MKRTLNAPNRQFKMMVIFIYPSHMKNELLPIKRERLIINNKKIPLMTRELITRASYLNTNFNQVIYTFLRYARNSFFLFLPLTLRDGGFNFSCLLLYDIFKTGVNFMLYFLNLNLNSFPKN